MQAINIDLSQKEKSKPQTNKQKIDQCSNQTINSAKAQKYLKKIFNGHESQSCPFTVEERLKMSN